MCTVDTNQPAPSRRTGRGIRRSGPIGWGWSLSDPALFDSHLGCPAIYPNFLMTYEIIRLDRRPSRSVRSLGNIMSPLLCSLQRCQEQGAHTVWNINCCNLMLLTAQSTACDAVFEETRAFLHRDRSRLAPTPTPTQLNKVNSPGARAKYSGQCSASGAGPAFQVGNASRPFPLGAPQTPPSLSTLPRVSLCQSEMPAIPPPPLPLQCTSHRPRLSTATTNPRRHHALPLTG